jgi:hypothetical protein
MVQGENNIAKPAGSSFKTMSRPQRDVLEDKGISAVRVKIFSQYADSSSSDSRRPTRIWIVKLAK